jgi:hypothetical protein
MIGPFANNNKSLVEIFFRLYVPSYIRKAAPEFSVPMEISSFADICIDGRGMPLSISIPLEDSCLIELEQEDSYNGNIFSLSLTDRTFLDVYRHNYADVAFAIGQRAKYFFSKAYIPLDGTPLHKYIEKLQRIEPFRIYSDFPGVEVTESGEFVPK